MSTSTREYAQLLASLGAVVFPVSLWTKQDGKKGVSAPPAWGTYPSSPASVETAYAVDCGRSGVVVVDLDRKPGADGVDYWDAHGYPRSTFEVTTQAGGRHMWFRATGDLDAARTGSLPKIGVDVRGVGGMVFGPGSVVAGGGTYLADALPPSLAELPEFPASVVAECRAENATRVRAAAGERHPEAFVDYPVTADAVERCRLDVERAWAVLEESVSGGFNDALLRACCEAARWFRARRDAGEDELTVEDARQWVVDEMNGSTVIGPADSSDEGTIYRSRTVEQAFAEPSHHVAQSLADQMVNGIIERQGGLTPAPTYAPTAQPLPAYSAQEAIARTDDDELTRFRAEFLSVAQLGSLPRPKWLLHNLVPAEALVRLSGTPGSYKSFLALDMALCVATGRNWQGLNTRSGPVLYLAGEGAGAQQDRVVAWMRHNQVTEVPDDTFLLLPRMVLTNAEEWNLLVRLVQQVRPALIVLDTQQRTTAGVEENSASEMASVVERWDWLVKQGGATVLVVHHLGKDASKGARGSSVVNASVDTEMVLTRTEGTQLATLSTTKQKNAAEAEEWEMVAESIVISPPHDVHAKVIPMPETSLALRRATAADKVATDGTFERQVLDAVVRLAPAEGGAVALTSLRYELEVNDDAGRKRLQRALSTLVKAEQLTREGSMRAGRFALPAAAA